MSTFEKQTESKTVDVEALKAEGKDIWGMLQAGELDKEELPSELHDLADTVIAAEEHAIEAEAESSKAAELARHQEVIDDVRSDLEKMAAAREEAARIAVESAVAFHGAQKLEAAKDEAPVLVTNNGKLLTESEAAAELEGRRNGYFGE